MSSATVRAALTSYFAAAAVDGPSKIAGLNKVFSAPPFWADGSEWNLADNLGSGAIAAMHLVEDHESRITVPAIGGQKAILYKVGLMVFYQWLKPSGLTAPAEDAWAAPLDVIIDGLKARLRADPNCGMPSVIWQAGQDTNDIRIQRDIPRQLPGKVLAWNVLEFFVTEVITA